jgi:hypothetical protein
MTFAGLNYLAVLIAAVAAFAWGAAYYMTLSRQWLAAVGMTKEQLGEKRSPVPFVVSFVALLVMGWVLAGTLGHLGPGQVTVKNGVISALFLWLGFIVNHGVRQQRLSRPQVQPVGDRQHPLAGRRRHPGRRHRRPRSRMKEVRRMKRPRIEGYAVISREGMIATSAGKFPEELKIPADHDFYQRSVAAASAVANGRHSARAASARSTASASS